MLRISLPLLILASNLPVWADRVAYLNRPESVHYSVPAPTQLQLRQVAAIAASYVTLSYKLEPELKALKDARICGFKGKIMSGHMKHSLADLTTRRNTVTAAQTLGKNDCNGISELEKKIKDEIDSLNYHYETGLKIVQDPDCRNNYLPTAYERMATDSRAMKDQIESLARLLGCSPL